jgi:hypothetical protein
MRWRRPGDESVAWRAWLGSRNLTRDLSRDAGLLLVQAPDPNSGHSLPHLARAAKALQSHLSQRSGRFSARDLEDLSAVRWAAPKGVGEMQVHWLDGNQGIFPAPKSQRRVIVVSPFVDARSIEAACNWVERDRKPVIIAAESELVRECDPGLARKADLCTFAAAPEEGLAYEPPPSRANIDAGDAERELDRSDEARAYHAKLIYIRSAKERRLWLGSPNLTERAWSRNFEIVAELCAMGRDPWGDVLEELARHARRFEPPATRQEKRNPTEDLRKALCADLKCHQQRDGNSVMLVASKWPSVPEGAADLLVGLPWTDREPIAWPWGTTRLSLGRAKLEECSDFLLFVLRQEAGEARWLMHAPFIPGLEADRDRAAIASYLGPDGYLRLISEEMEPARSSAPPWDAPHTGFGQASSRIVYEVGLPTLEGLLRLALRNPERLRAVAETVAMLEQEAVKWSLDSTLDSVQRTALDDFRRLWSEVGIPLTERADGTDA